MGLAGGTIRFCVMSKSIQDPPWRAWGDSIGPLLFSFLLLTGLLFYLYGAVLRFSGGHFGYPMDDTYIHMAMARSASQHGVWGLTQYQFSSTSSSLLYTAILSAVYALVGISELAPFYLNVVFAFVLMFLCDIVLKKGAIPAWPRAAVLTLIIFGMPLAPEVIAGMEHILHTVLTIAFIYCAVRMLLDPPGNRSRASILLSLAALTVLARYEALALIAVAAILLFLRGRRWYAVSLVVAASLPVAMFGLYSVYKGWFPVPNSIVAKASRPEKSYVSYPIHWAEQLYATPSVAFLLVAGIVLLYLSYRRTRNVWSVECLTLWLFIPTTLLHMQFARVGWFYRYEAYLVVFGLYACSLALARLELQLSGRNYPNRNTLAYGSFFLVAILSFESRAVGALWLTPWACKNIYEQQYQMGRFLKQYDPSVTVMMNDIGAAGFLSDARIVDLYGLATIEVARAKVHHRFTQDFRRSLAINTGTKIAVIYPGMYRDVGGLPAEWIQVGTWKIPQNQICWGDTVGFYAVDPTDRDRLVADLRDFAPELPAGVTQSGLYTER